MEAPPLCLEILLLSVLTFSCTHARRRFYAFSILVDAWITHTQKTRKCVCFFVKIFIGLRSIKQTLHCSWRVHGLYEATLSFLRLLWFFSCTNKLPSETSSVIWCGTLVSLWWIKLKLQVPRNSSCKKDGEHCLTSLYFTRCSKLSSWNELKFENTIFHNLLSH
jgi:hypothetical protein